MLLGSSFICIGLGVTGYGVYEIIRGLVAHNWSTVNGVITTSVVESYTIRRNVNNMDATMYRPRVEYEYVIGGESFIGDRIRFGEIGAGDVKYARSFLNRYPVNASVTIYFNGANPGESLLEPGIHRSMWLKMLYGGGFLFFGALALFVLGGSDTRDLILRRLWIRN